MNVRAGGASVAGGGDDDGLLGGVVLEVEMLKLPEIDLIFLAFGVFGEVGADFGFVDGFGIFLREGGGAGEEKQQTGDRALVHPVMHLKTNVAGKIVRLKVDGIWRCVSVNGWRGGESEKKREEIAEDVGNGLGGRTKVRRLHEATARRPLQQRRLCVSSEVH